MILAYNGWKHVGILTPSISYIHRIAYYIKKLVGNSFKNTRSYYYFNSSCSKIANFFFKEYNTILVYIFRNNLYSTKCSSETLQNLLYPTHKKSPVIFCFVFSFCETFSFSLYECPVLCQHRPGHLSRTKKGCTNCD